VKGTTVWKNPKGYLPGTKQPLLPFHAAISLLYVLLSGTWLSFHLIHKGQIQAPQHLVTLCVTLGMIESCMDYADVYSVNSSGFMRPIVTVAAIAVSCMFKTIVRLTVLLLARGFGTFRPVGGDRDCYVFGVIHFACGACSSAC
jgi:hypothetical protein